MSKIYASVVQVKINQFKMEILLWHPFYNITSRVDLSLNQPAATKTMILDIHRVSQNYLRKVDEVTRNFALINSLLNCKEDELKYYLMLHHYFVRLLKSCHIH